MRKCRLIGSLVAVAMVFGATQKPCSVKKKESTGRKIIDLRRNISRKVKCANPSGFRYTLSDDVDCYVIDKSLLSWCEERNIRDYLQGGGYILINDEAVTMEDVDNFVNLGDGRLGFLDIQNKYGTLLFEREGSIQVYSYTVGFINDSDKAEYSEKDLSSLAEEKISSLKLDDIIDWLIDYLRQHSEDSKGEDSGSDSAPVEEKVTKGIALGSASCINLLYGVFSGKHMCSYQIDSKVIQGQKYIDSSTGNRRGIYDIVTKYTVDAEPNYRIYQYTPKISSPESIIDASYINSNVTEEYSLGGEIGFDGKEIGAKVNFGYCYSGSSTVQDIVNDFPVGQGYRRWIARPFNGGVLDAAYQLKPSIRIISYDDTAPLSASLTLHAFRIYNDWWIPIAFHMVDSCRKTMNLTWKADEEVSSTENMG